MHLSWSLTIGNIFQVTKNNSFNEINCCDHEKQLIFFLAVIPAGVNITHMSTQIKAAVDEEQSKVLWVPVSKP